MDNNYVISLDSSDDEKERTQLPVIVNVVSLKTKTAEYSRSVAEMLKRKINDHIRNQSTPPKKIKTDLGIVSKDTKEEKIIVLNSDISHLKNLSLVKIKNTTSKTKELGTKKRGNVNNYVIDITDDSDEPYIVPAKVTPESLPKVISRQVSKKSTAKSAITSNKVLLETLAKRNIVLIANSIGKNGLTTSKRKPIKSANNKILDIEETPSTSACSLPNLTRPKVNIIKPRSPVRNHDEESIQSTSTIDTSNNITVQPYFEKFINLLRSMDKDTATELIIKKLTRYYNEIDDKFINCEEYCKLVEDSTKCMENNPSRCYYFVEDVMEYMKRHRPYAKEVKQSKHIRKLENTLKKCGRIIQKLEEEEVDFDEEENSTFLKVHEYQKRYVCIYKKICQLKNQNADAGRAIYRNVEFPKGKYPELDKAAQSFIHKSKSFPDFLDITKIVEDCNEKYSLKLSKDAVKLEAQDTFQRLGKELQRRRQADFYESMSTALGTTTDPALDDVDLGNKLKQNQKDHGHKEQEVINKYVHMAAEQKLTPMEINATDDAEEFDSEEDDSKEEDRSVNNEEDLSISGTEDNCSETSMSNQGSLNDMT